LCETRCQCGEEIRARPESNPLKRWNKSLENIKTKITLIRHGKPKAHDDYSSFSIISGKNIEQFIKAWNTCELQKKYDTSSLLKEIISDGNLFISSNLKRTHESFKIIGVSEFESYDFLNEAELPFGIGNSIKMPLVIWLIALRLMWRFGLKINSESHKDFVERIRKCVNFLVEKGNEKHTIVMAHGFVNRNIKKELMKRDWKLISSKGGHNYWSYSTFGKV
jgi:hypothetical protein